METHYASAIWFIDAAIINFLFPEKRMIFRKFSTCILCLYFFIQITGCASDSNAAKGAAQGAAKGAMAGAVGGLLSSLVFGGDPAEKAARGAVYGGATGAVAGGIAGHELDKQNEAEQLASLEALRKEIGDDAYEGLSSLAECQHLTTLDLSTKAQRSDNPNYRLAGLWLEVLSFADSHQEERARNLLPMVVKEDWDINSVSQAEEVMRQGMVELVDIRKEFNLPPVCPA